jgi:hypothetical protein
LQIPDVLGHGRSRGAGQKKEDDEGIRFHTLLTAGMHRGGQISPEKRVAAVCSSFSWAAALVERRLAGGGRQGARRGAAAGARAGGDA